MLIFLIFSPKYLMYLKYIIGENMLNLSYKNIIKSIFPSVFMMTFMALYTMIDGIFVSRFINTDALSAINISYPYVNLCFGIAMMLGSGGCAITMKKLGEKNIKEAKKDFSLIILFTIVFSILMSILALKFLSKIINLLGGTQNTFDYCKDYLFFMILFTPTTILKFTIERFLVSVGKEKIAFFLCVVGGIINIVLDYILIKVLNLGIMGAGIATSFGYAIPAVFGLIIFISKKNILHYTSPSKNLKILFKVCSNGFSEMIFQVASGFIIFLFNYIMLKYVGENGVAAITIVLYYQFIVVNMFTGVAMGIAPKISFFYGNEDNLMLKKLNKFGIKLIIFLSVITYLSFLILSPVLTQLFTGKDTEVFKITIYGIKYFSPAFLMIGINIYIYSMFTAFSNGLIASILSFLRCICFEIIFIVLLPILLGNIGIWLAVPISQFIGLCISILFYLKYKKVYKY